MRDNLPGDDDTDAMMAEAKAVDTMFSARTPSDAVDFGADPALLANLCRALEREAEGALPALDRQHLLDLHRSLSSMREQVEQFLRKG